MKRLKYFLYKKDIDRLEAIKTYIMANTEKDLRIHSLAALYHISKTTLQRHFFAHENVPLHTYVFECRMEKAQELLRDNSLSIHEISLTVGFCSFSAFTHAFTNYFGYNPFDYRKKSN